MKRKVKVIIGLGCVSLACIGLAACSPIKTEVDLLEEQGYLISVTYDSNGGKFTNRSGMTIVNMFKPDDYTDSDADGTIEISLKTTDPTSIKDIGAPTRNGYTFAGWYQECDINRNAEGKPLDNYGNVLEQRSNGLYYIEGSAEDSSSVSVSYVYSDFWDVANKPLTYELGSGKMSVTLYAAWVPRYQYNYYYQSENSTEWTLFGSTTFDYSTTESFKNDYVYTDAIEETYDSETLWVPHWTGENDTGEMSHKHEYTDKASFTFPSLSGYTFLEAFTDPSCTAEYKISEQFQHQGTLVYDWSTGKLNVNNLVQNIYVRFEEGEQYRVTTADEFVSFATQANSTSVYTILANELDFTDKVWPSNLASGEFTGTIIGNGCVFKNISAKNNDTSQRYGGLFGHIGNGAVIKDISFVNVEYDMTTGSTAILGNGMFVYFGVLTGYAEEGATVTGVTLEKAVLKMGRLERTSYQIHLCGNGLKSVTYSDISVVLLGTSATISGETKYRYFVSVSVNETSGIVTPTVELSSSRAEVRDESSYVAYPVMP